MEQQQEKKKRLNSKSKGSGFEGQIAKKLTAALQPLNFIRTQGSGARVGGKNFETIGKMFGEDALKLFVGDVVPTNERDSNVTFHFSVETKFYKTPDNFTSLVSGTANVFKWMQESIDDSAKIEKVPLLIFKWNRTDIYVAALSGTMEGLVQPKLTIKNPKMSLDVYILEDLLAVREFWITTNVSPE